MLKFLTLNYVKNNLKLKKIFNYEKVFFFNLFKYIIYFNTCFKIYSKVISKINILINKT